MSSNNIHATGITILENSNSEPQYQCETDLSCQICNKTFPTPTDVCNHMISHNYRHECPVCNKVFAGNNKLNKHLFNKHYVRSNQNVFKPFGCDNCDKAYTTLSNLTMHKETHSGITKLYYIKLHVLS